MKIILFSQFYKPERIAAAFRASEHAQIWANEKAQVTVFTGYPNYPEGRIFAGYNVELLKEINDDGCGIRILRSKLVAKPNTTIVKRVINAFSFMFFGIVNILFNSKKIGKEYNVVIATSGTIFAAFLGWLFAKKIKRPYVLEIRDITFRQLMATGAKENSFKVKIMKRLELFLCRKAQKIVVVTHGFKKVLCQNRIADKKIEVITNGVDIQKVSPAVHNNETDKFMISYFGTLGISQNIHETLKYAHEIKRLIGAIEYLIIGEGAQKSLLEQEIIKTDNNYVRIFPGMNPGNLEPYYQQSKMCLVVLNKSDNFQYTIPSKLFQIMGHGRAVLFIGPAGEAADIVDRYHIGLTLTGSFEEDCSKIKMFFGNPDYLKQLEIMGNNGRETISKKYLRDNLARRYLTLLREVCNN